ncbi:hypothetical protein C8F04DRAFT_959348 [Mycena alexandri]|uniref:GATA-type domain-containing protein n=1 Tax=Mycena alexandri TaxID=1745969 RepID=A0AAD6ST93_9AGAR|nr:hypothetical protein C8F04DRAFT_959348 [Mycena alexandri]
MYPDPGEWRASPRPPYPYHRDEGAPWHPAPDARLPPHHWTPHAGPATHYPNHYVPYCPPSPAPAPAYLLPPSLHAAAPPPPSTSARRARRTTADGAPPKTCAHCHATSTPLWRREPATQCVPLPLHACGLYLQQRHTLRPQALIDADAPDADADSAPQIPDAEYTGPKCSHCLTRSTSVWRRSKTGAKVCNACGVYARLRGKDRPLSLRRNKIKPRTKHAR